MAVAVPLISSIVTGFVLSRVFARPSGAAAIGWWVGIALASTLVLMGVDRFARRLLPLAVLLKLSMAFPDQAPSRFSMAARAGSTRNLKEELRRAEEQGATDEPAVAAQRILTLVGALSTHDRRTRGHSERVRAFNDLIAAELRLPQGDRDRLRWAALLHDIGKLHVSPRLLNKPSRPTEKEWEILKSHPARGARITAPLEGWLGPWANTIVQHHERWDGSGYPAGLKETEIGLGARIVAVADAYEVMTAPRPYSRPVSAEAARKELARCAGEQFDPEVVRAFLNISIGSLRRTIGPISWLAQLPLLSSAPRLEAAVGVAGRQVATVAATGTATAITALGAMHTAPHQHHRGGHDAQLTLAGSSQQAAPRAADAPRATPQTPTPTADAPRAHHVSHTARHRHHAGDTTVVKHRLETNVDGSSSGSGRSGSSGGSGGGSSTGSGGHDQPATHSTSGPSSGHDSGPTDTPSTGTSQPPAPPAPPGGSGGGGGSAGSVGSGGSGSGGSDSGSSGSGSTSPDPQPSASTPPPTSGDGGTGTCSGHGQDDGHGEDQDHTGCH